MSYPVGSIIADRYQVNTVFSQHHGGGVYQVFDIDLGQRRTLKQFSQLTSAEFTSWAKSLQRRIHPNLAEVVDFFSLDDHSHFLVMEYVPGESLQKAVQNQQRMEVPQVLRWLGATLSALEYLHSRSTPGAHGNLTPGSILLTDANQVVLTGYHQGEGNPAEPLTMLAPERRQGVSDARSDVYELGASLYFALSGRVPGQGAVGLPDPSQIEPLKKYAPEVPSGLARAIHKALSPTPEMRFANAREFRSALGKAGVRWSEEVSPVLTEASRARARRYQLSLWGQRAAVLALVCLLVGGLGWGITRWWGQRAAVAVVLTATASHSPSASPTMVAQATLQAQTFTPLPPPSATLLPADTANFTAPAPASATRPAFTASMASVTSTPSAETPSVTATSLVVGEGTLPAAPFLQETRLAESDGMPLARIPAGAFWMGTDTLDVNYVPEQGPRQWVYLPEFWIDQHEVTNAQFGACVKAGKCTPPEFLSSAFVVDYFGNAQYAEFPVLFVDWKQAGEYCLWAGRRLPLEVEWEKAARGADGRIYPWGNQPPTAQLANFGITYGDTIAVNSLPAGNSPYGVADMAGNVAEWSASYYTLHYFNLVAQLTALPDPKTLYRNGIPAVRNGAWNDDSTQVRAPYRWAAPNAGVASAQIGFRCATER